MSLLDGGGDRFGQSDRRTLGQRPAPLAQPSSPYVLAPTLRLLPVVAVHTPRSEATTTLQRRETDGCDEDRGGGPQWGGLPDALDTETGGSETIQSYMGRNLAIAPCLAGPAGWTRSSASSPGRIALTDRTNALWHWRWPLSACSSWT